MSMPTGDPTGNPGTLISNVPTTPVSPAQVFPPAPVQTFTPTPSNEDVNEKRIRDLMSAKDKANAAAAQAQQQAVQAQQELERLQAAHSEQIQGAVSATEALLQAKVKLEAQQVTLAAENTKLKVLMQYPDILPYAEFIPAAADEAGVKANIERFQAARAADKARQPATPPVQADAPAMRAIYPPNSLIPPASPAAAPTATYDTSLANFQQRVKAIEHLPPAERTAKFGELVKEAEALARQQMGQQ